MARPELVQIRNFRCFRGDHEVVLHPGVHWVRGVNVDTGGDSGAGKSTLLLAISYGLARVPFPMKELTCWDTDDSALVQIKMSDGARVLRGEAERGVWLPGQERMTRGAAALDRYLETSFGPIETRLAVTYRPQGQPAHFLPADRTAKQKILNALLGLQPHQDALAETARQARVAADEVERVGARHGQVRAVAEREVEEARLVVEQAEAAVADLRGRLAPAQAEADALSRARQLSDVGAAARRAGEAVAARYDHQIAEARGVVQKLRQRLDRARQMARGADQGTIGRLEETERLLGYGTCPTCGQGVGHDLPALEALRRQLAELRGAPARAAEVTGMVQQALQQAERDLQTLEVERRGAVAEAEAVERARLAQQVAADEARAADAWRVATELLEQVRGAEEQLGSARFHLHRVAQAREAWVRAEGELEGAKRAAILEREARACLGGYLDRVVAERLAELGARTNAILADLPNTHRMSLRFELVSGRQGLEIATVATFGGREWPLRSGASGGQGAAAALACDLALGQIVRSGTGVDPGWLLLDESLHGLDEPTKRACLQLLRRHAGDRVVLVADRDPWMGQEVDGQVVVEYRAGRARVVA